MSVDRYGRFIILLFFAALVVSGCGQDIIEPEKQFFYRVAERDYPIFVPGDGMVEPMIEKNVSTPTVRGEMIIEYLAPEGEIIEKDAVAVRFDTLEMENRILRDSLRLQLQKISYRTNEEGNKLKSFVLGSTTLKKQEYLGCSERILALLKEGMDPDEIEKYRINIDKDRIEEENYTLQFDSRKRLNTLGFISELEIERLGYEKSRAGLQRMKDENYFNMLNAGSDVLDINRYDQEVRKHSIDSKLAVDDRDSKIKVNELNLEKSRIRMERNEASTRRRQGELERCVVKAPCGGVVLYQSNWQGKIRVGSRCWRGMAIMKIADLSKLKVVSRVDERFVDFISVGSTAEIRMVSQPERVFPGRVITINKVAELKEKGDIKGAKFFTVEVEIDGENLPIRPRETARVSILKKRYEKKPVVPRDCVISEETGRFVMIKSGGGTEKRAITVLDEDEDFCVIGEGLEPGQEVAFVY